uniref:Transcriptional repressor NrdR n=1 Tax=Lygus hesperus TaxID=30085 RepID=A0A0A9XLY9_LYGHE
MSEAQTRASLELRQLRADLRREREKQQSTTNKLEREITSLRSQLRAMTSSSMRNSTTFASIGITPTNSNNGISCGNMTTQRMGKEKGGCKASLPTTREFLYESAQSSSPSLSDVSVSDLVNAVATLSHG